jgi:pimeloyl-ACP methyl ester carboxylesterase
MQALGIQRAHISGLSLGTAVGMWLGVKYPDRVRSLSLHSGWTKTDPFIKKVVEGWQVMAKALDSVPEMIIMGIFPWCFTPEFYSSKQDYIESLAAFVRSRPVQPVAAFNRQSNAVLAHDVEAQLARISAPTQITFGRHDLLTAHFADRIKGGIRGSELEIFEACSHAPIYEKVEEFNQKTIAFLQRQSTQAGHATH